MLIEVNAEIGLDRFRPEDAADLVEHLNDTAIYAGTLRIPHPYTSSCAAEFLACVAATTADEGRPRQFAIRARDSRLIGGCGFEKPSRFSPHRSEIGYWLARPYWGRGWMTAAIRRLVRHAHDEWELVRLTAWIFAWNEASARVLAKCGFQEEGYLRQHYLKSGQYIDGRMFGRLKSDPLPE